MAALLSPEVVRRRVRSIFRPVISVPTQPETGETVRTETRTRIERTDRPISKGSTRPVPKLTPPRSKRVPKSSKPPPKHPVPKPSPTMADYSSISGFHLKFGPHPTKSNAQNMLNSIYGSYFPDDEDFFQNALLRTGVNPDIVQVVRDKAVDMIVDQAS